MADNSEEYARLPGAGAAGTREEVSQAPGRRQVVLVMGGVMLAVFLASLDQTIVATAIPRIIADLEGFDRFTWVTTAYLVTSTTVVPIVGRLTDMFGRKWFFILGIAIFLLGSILAGVSQNMTELIIFRGLQGVGGGTIFAISMISIADLFPPEDRGKYQGMLGGVFALSSVIGPSVGGLVADNLSWQWIFYINLPLGIPIIFLFITRFPNLHSPESSHKIDFLGISALVCSVIPLLLALSWGGVQYDWVSAQTLGLLAFSGVTAAAFVFIESKASQPIIPPALFSYPVVRVSLLLAFLTGFVIFGSIVFIPLYFQGVLGSSATSSGSFLTPMMLSIVAGSIISGQAIARLGGHYRLHGLLGLFIMGAGMALLSLMSASTGHGQAVGNIVIMGFGMGITFPVYTLIVQHAVPHGILGVATSSVQFFRSIGGTIGLAILGSLMTSRFASGLAGAAPPEVRAALSPGHFAAMGENPQAILDPDAKARLQETFVSLGPEGAGLYDKLLAGLREALASSLSDVFLISLGVIAVAWVATIFLKDVPFQQGRWAAG